MHHPGPPRFVSVGDVVELAPRDPDPSATYAWTVEEAPAAADVTLGDEPVEHVAPDAPGRYVVALRAPDGVHRLTIRAFPGPPESERLPEGHSGRHSGTVVESRGQATERTSGYRDSSPPGERRGDGGRPRIRLDGAVEDGVVRVRATPRPHPDGPETAAELDVTFVVDDRDDLGRAGVTVEGRELVIPIDRLPDLARIHAVAVGEAGHSVADAVAIERAASSDVTVTRPYDPPAWATEAVYYEVYLRTFAPGAPDGEILRAVGDRLDHLADLGVDVLWLTPVLQNDHAPHGYNITDFFAVASDLGDRAALQDLVRRAHDRGIKVLFDLVLNHSARDHPHFRDAYGDPDSPYREWYEWQESGEPGTYFDWEYIANFDFDSLAVRRHLLDVVDAWAPLVDGFRCDMAWAVPNAFWREVHDRVKAEDPSFLLLDETIPYIPDFQEGLFDVHFDSTTYASLRSVGTGWAPAESLLDAVEGRRDIGFPDHAGFLLYAENHDETRYLVECGRPATRAAAGALCTLPGAPLVYAGQELGQRGQRDDVVWDTTDEALTEHYRRLLALRRTTPALASDAPLRRVDYEVTAGDPDRVVAFRRGDAGPADDDPADAGPADDHGGVDASPSDGRDDLAGAGTSTYGAATGEAGAVLVACHFDEGTAELAVDLPVEPVDAVTGESVLADGSVTVDDVVVLPTTAGEREQRD